MGHHNNSIIQETAKSKTVDGMPTKIPLLRCDCYLYLLCKISHNQKSTIPFCPDLSPFRLCHCDFSFHNLVSRRGFKSVFSLLCETTRCLFVLSTQHNRSPLDLFTWIYHAVHYLGYKILCLRVDESREIARNTEFNLKCIELNVIVQSTVGGASWLNRKVERSHRTLFNGIRVLLANASSMEGYFWCFAAQCFCHILHRVVHTRMKATLCFLVYKRKSHFSNFRIFDSHNYKITLTIT